MKIITLLTVVALMLVAASAPKSSVGGPMTIFFVLFIAMLVVAGYEAVLNRRGPLGWIVNIVVAVVAGLVAASVGSSVLELLMMTVRFGIEGSLMSTQHPILYVFMAAMAAVTVWGSWFGLQVVNRFRKTQPPVSSAS